MIGEGEVGSEQAGSSQTSGMEQGSPPIQTEAPVPAPAETAEVSQSIPTAGLSLKENTIVTPNVVNKAASEQEAHVVGVEHTPFVPPAVTPEVTKKGLISRAISWFRNVLSFGASETFDTLSKGQQINPLSTQSPRLPENQPQNT